MNTNTATIYAEVKWSEPYAVFTFPTFKFLKKAPETIIFWTKKEAEKFIKALPKEWLVRLIVK